jgi:hypothetical protein
VTETLYEDLYAFLRVFRDNSLAKYLLEQTIFQQTPIQKNEAHMLRLVHMFHEC